MRLYLLVFIIVGGLIMLGLASTERAIEDVLRDGYSTTAQVVSAETTGRRFPIVFDGWRPRWVDESLSVELKWMGRDGAERGHSGVPVSDAFAAKILSGDKVKLVEVAVRVIDDDSSLPIIEEDVKDRLRHIHGFSDVARSGVILFSLAFVALVAWERLFASRARSAPLAEASRPERPFPFVLTVLTMFSLVLGGSMASSSWSDRRDFQETNERGESVIAKITRAHAEVARAGESPSYLVDLAWRDSSGQERVFGPTHVSANFWRWITTNGALTTDQTEIRYLARDPASRPIIVADAAEREFQDAFGVDAGVGFVVLGLIFGGLLAYRLRSA